MRRGEPVPRAFQAPVDVHASVDGQVYMFRRRHDDSADSSENEELSVLDVRPWGRAGQERAESLQLLEREVSVGDNLNKLALQYGCKVADIKRANNLFQEQDLFALKSIRIPVKKHGLLTEANAELKDPQRATSLSPPPPLQPGDGPGDASPAGPRLQHYADFLKGVDHDIEKLIQTTDAHEELISEGAERAQKSGSGAQRLTGYGADWGIQWWNAVVAMLLIGIFLPIFYVVYFKTKDTGVSAVDGSGMLPTNGSGADAITHLGHYSGPDPGSEQSA